MSTLLRFYVYYVCYALRLTVSSLSEHASQRVVRGHASVVARVFPVSLPFVSQKRVHIRRRLLLLEQPPHVRRYPLVPPLLGDVRRHLLLGHDRFNVNVDCVLGLGLGFAPLGVGIAHHVPCAGFVSDALPVSLGPRPEGLDGALSVLSQAGALGPSGFLEHAEPDVIGADLRRRPGGLAPGATRDEVGDFVSTSSPSRLDRHAAPPLGSIPGTPGPAPDPGPINGRGRCVSGPRGVGDDGTPGPEHRAGRLVHDREILCRCSSSSDLALFYLQIRGRGHYATTRRRDDATTRDSKRGGFERGERVRR